MPVRCSENQKRAKNSKKTSCNHLLFLPFPNDNKTNACVGFGGARADPLTRPRANLDEQKDKESSANTSETSWETPKKPSAV
jgi:hypothetical protein